MSASATHTGRPSPAPTVAGEALASGADDAIYDRIVSAILDHRLPPGTKLGEERLAQAFGVSRTRIRPVLARLAQERVVTLAPHRGATVARPDPQEAREVFEVRRMMEAVLVERFVASATRADIENLARCLRAEEAALARRDLHRAIRLAGDFHLYIARQSGHRTLDSFLRELVARSSLILMAYGAPDKPAHEDGGSCACTDHHALLDAIRKRDADTAKRLMRAHLERLEAQLHLAPSNDEALDFTQLFSAA